MANINRVYNPLPCSTAIRIMRLYPASKFNDPLKFDFIVQDRLSIIQNCDLYYDCISYVWGEPNLTHTIRNEEHYADLKITAHVDVMLRYFRRETDTQNLWVDALCLNQIDNDEKSMQVPLMGEIYTQARKVRVWLGEANENTLKVFTFLRAMACLELRPGSVTPDVTKKTLMDIFGAGSSAPIDVFLCNRWFERRWVLQEAVLNPDTTLHSGEFKIPWGWFTNGLRALLKVVETLPFSPSARAALSTGNYLRQSSGDLLENLRDFHTSECKDPLDRVYALYGLTLFRSGRDQDHELIADYSLKWSELYQQIAETYFQNERGIELIRDHLVPLGSLWEKNSLLPSWVPNWSIARQHMVSPFKSSLWSDRRHLLQENNDCEIKFIEKYSLKGIEIKSVYDRDLDEVSSTLLANSTRDDLFAVFHQEISHTMSDLKYWREQYKLSEQEQIEVIVLVRSIEFFMTLSVALNHYVELLSKLKGPMLEFMKCIEFTKWTRVEDIFSVILFLTALLRVFGLHEVISLGHGPAAMSEYQYFVTVTDMLYYTFVRYWLKKDCTLISRETSTGTNNMQDEFSKLFSKYKTWRDIITSDYLPNVEIMLRNRKFIRTKGETGMICEWIVTSSCQAGDTLVVPHFNSDDGSFFSIALAFILRPESGHSNRVWRLVGYAISKSMCMEEQLYYWNNFRKRKFFII